MIYTKIVFLIVGIILGALIYTRLKHYSTYLKVRRVCKKLSKEHNCKIMIKEFYVD